MEWLWRRSVDETRIDANEIAKQAEELRTAREAFLLREYIRLTKENEALSLRLWYLEDQG